MTNISNLFHPAYYDGIMFTNPVDSQVHVAFHPSQQYQYKINVPIEPDISKTVAALLSYTSALDIDVSLQPRTFADVVDSFKPH